jgi:hypothetical protein
MNSENDNVIAFPGARFDANQVSNSIKPNQTGTDREGLTEREWLELEKKDLIFSNDPDKNRDIAYELAFKGNNNFDITNLYHRPRFAQDFELPEELQVAFQKLEIQFNQWDYLIRKIAYYKRS